MIARSTCETYFIWKTLRKVYVNECNNNVHAIASTLLHVCMARVVNEFICMCGIEVYGIGGMYCIQDRICKVV
jgi:hypothetical protein